MRALVSLLSCLLLANASAQEDGKPMSDKEAARFWGIAKSLMTWSHVEGPDFDVYYGHARAPLDAGVGIYMGMHPSFQEPEEPSAASGHLGSYAVRWAESRADDGSLRKEALVHVGEFHKIHLWIYGKHQTDIDAIEEELSTYPVFSPKPSSSPSQ